MPPIVTLRSPAWLEEFQAFIAKGNVIDLAVGIIIGAAFTTVVNSLVKDLFNPLFGLLIGGIDFGNLFITLKGQHEPTLDAARAAGAVTLNVGVFLNAVIQFLIVGFAVFWLIKALSRLHMGGSATPPNKSEVTPPNKSEVLLAEIRDLLREWGAPEASPEAS